MLTIELDKKVFKPGESISGKVIWTNERTETERIEMRLIWYTEGKGDQDFEIIDSITLDLGANAQNGQSRFDFVAPHRPLSFSGKLISLIWAVEAIVYPGKHGERTDIVISRTDREIKLDRSFESDIKQMLKFGT